MELKGVRFGIELEMFGLYPDDNTLINIIHKECERQLLPIRLVSARDDYDNEGVHFVDNSKLWVIKNDGSINPPKRGVALNIQKTGYKKGEQYFLPIQQVQHAEPENSTYDTEVKYTTPENEKFQYADKEEYKKSEVTKHYTESRITNSPVVMTGDEELKAHKIGEHHYNTFEIVSPPLKFVDSNIKLVGDFLDILRRIRMKVNASTGIHVHVSFPEINLFTFLKIYEFVDEKKIKELWPSRFGNNMTASKSKMKDDVYRYLEDLTYSGVNKYAIINNISPLMKEIDDRYFGINIQSIQKYGTIEFRYAAGSVRSDVVTQWLHYLRDLIDFCIKTKTLNNFLGNFDIEEEVSGHIKIHDRHRNRTIESNSLIDEFSIQNKDINTFLKEKKKGISFAKHEIRNYVDHLNSNHSTSVFSNIIKFINALIDDNKLTPQSVFEMFYEYYENKMDNTDDDDYFYDDDDDNDNNKTNTEDTIIFLLNETLFKKLDAKTIAELIDNTESIQKKFVVSIIKKTKQNISEFLDKRFLIDVVKYAYDHMEFKPKDFYLILKKIGSENAFKVLSILDFNTILKYFDFSSQTLNSIIDFSKHKDFLKEKLDHFIYLKTGEFSKTRVVNPNIDIHLTSIIKFFIANLGIDEVVDVFKDKDKYFILAMCNSINMNGIKGQLSDFTDKLLSSITNKEENKSDAILSLKRKELNKEKINAFDIYSALTSADDSEFLEKWWLDPEDYKTKPYFAALFLGRSFILAKTMHELAYVGKSYKDIEKDYTDEERNKYVIDLFKLLFKQYDVNKLMWINTFIKDGIYDFLKLEYINDIDLDELDRLFTIMFNNNVFDLRDNSDIETAEIKFLKLIFEKNDDYKYKFIMNALKNKTSGAVSAIYNKKFNEFMQKAIDHIDTNKLADAFLSYKENVNSSYPVKFQIYDYIVQEDALEGLDFNHELFKKKTIPFFEIDSRDYNLRSLISNLSTNNYKEKWDLVPEQSKLIFELMTKPDLEESKYNKILSLIKDDKDFFKEKLMAAMGTAGSASKGSMLLNQKFFIDALYYARNRVTSQEIPMFSYFYTMDFSGKVNFTKLSFIDKTLMVKFIEAYLTSVRSHHIGYNNIFEQDEKVFDVYEQIIRNKRLFKPFMEYNGPVARAKKIQECIQQYIQQYIQLKRIEFKGSSLYDDKDKDGYIWLSFNSYGDKYKASIEFVEKERNNFDFLIKVFKNNELSKRKELNYSVRSTAIHEIPEILKSVVSVKTGDMLEKMIGGVKVMDIILNFFFENININKVDIRIKPFKKKQFTESVKVIDYNKQFKKIMIEDGILNAKKYLLENKDFIKEPKLLAMIKQFQKR